VKTYLATKLERVIIFMLRLIHPGNTPTDILYIKVLDENWGKSG